MGYTKIYQYGNITEIYQYKKDLKNRTNYQNQAIIVHAKKYDIQNNKRNNQQKTKTFNRNSISRPVLIPFRTRRSIQRARKSFFRLCHANNCKAKTIHFLTLTLAVNTTYSNALRYISRFFNQLKNESKRYQEINYISVPEITKAGTYHFHLLIYNLPTELSSSERETRYLQRLWGRGYLDICLATSLTTGIAGYMAKYMAKYLASTTNEARRAYNCSRGIEKVTSHGSNSLYQELELFIPDKMAERVANFEVPFLGSCNYLKMKEKLKMKKL